MYRKVYNKLIEWKNSDSRKPLLLLGARQVGKTWLMKEFGRREYKNCVYINCDDEPMAKELFLADYDIKRLLVAFQAISGQQINEETTLIILDEIQETPRALHSLKYFNEKAPGYHIMAAGSLLGVTLAQQESFPVGKVSMLKVFPMDFEEFLIAVGEEQLCEMLRLHDHSLENAFAEKLTDFMRQYIYVGGMPEVVAAYAAARNINGCRRLQQDILIAYRNDISKHASKVESNRIRMV
ncbi:MAG: AAA family ATPase, partial [Muribaculaceae bacterium]|nr:AAA family ATPase [Muribaculaceae bacterium]